jgi:hypothetical protein
MARDGFSIRKLALPRRGGDLAIAAALSFRISLPRQNTLALARKTKLAYFVLDSSLAFQGGWAARC